MQLFYSFFCTKILVLTLFLGWFTPALFAQEGTQTVKGRITDMQSDYPITGATIQILNTNPVKGAVTDLDGYFKIENVPFGRVTLKVSFIGYTERIIPNVLVNAGKETVLTLKLEESVMEMEGVVVTAEVDKMGAQEEMSLISTRTFSLEEASRYAGSRNDPARMASNFAGVSGASDSRNDIIIRGNSPSGVLWRLEGTDVFSPNHFASFGTSGGPVSMLNYNLLDNSDFLSGAFSAQYGNVLSGVFDLQMRHGNKDKHEFLGQVGFNGFELGAEGPMGGKSSYLVNYRYSMLGFFDMIGIPLGTGTAVPYYQDLSFKVDMPTSKSGRFAVFGVGGLSNITFEGSELEIDADDDNFYSDSEIDLKNVANSGSVGISHLYFFNPKTSSKLILSVSGMEVENTLDTVFRRNDLTVESIEPYVYQKFTQTKYTLNYRLNKKFNVRNTLNSGVIMDLYQINLKDKALHPLIANDEVSNFDGNTTLLQLYSEWQHRFNDRTTLNIGAHYQHLFLNNSKALEPRLGFRYELPNRQSVTLGYGRHSQMQGTQVYFIETTLEDGSKIQTNKDLEFTNSDHFVLGYDNALGKNLRLKAEIYYQNITNAPIEQTPSYFSMLNAGTDFGLPDEDSLVNKGTGYNYGLELTVERFFANSYYFLLTTSLFESKYKGSDEIERNTAFNGGYVFNFLLGKEWQLNQKFTFGFDAKLTYAGNRRTIPIDLEASQNKGYEIKNYQQAYQEQFPDYFRMDLKIGLYQNGKKIRQEWAFDVQNVTNRKNVFMRNYTPRLERVTTTPQLGIFPVMQYRILW